MRTLQKLCFVLTTVIFLRLVDYLQRSGRVCEARCCVTLFWPAQKGGLCEPPSLLACIVLSSAKFYTYIIMYSEFTFYLQYGPRITPNNTAFVHHIIVYLCDGLVNVTEGTSSECPGRVTAGPINECRRGEGLGGWAVGGGVRTQQ